MGDFTTKQVSVKRLKNRKILEYLHEQTFEADSHEGLFNSGHWWLVFNKHGEPVAFAGLKPSRNWQKTGVLCRVGVMPSARGNRLQRRLINVRIAKARALGWEWMLSDTRDNPESANNLIRARFLMYSPRKPYGYEDTCYWKRRI